MEKCEPISIEEGKVIMTDRISLTKSNIIKDIDETGYKYLGMSDGEMITHQVMKDKIRREYKMSTKAILSTQC